VVGGLLLYVVFLVWLHLLIDRATVLRPWKI
jgi:hypothetical protein